MYCMSRPSLHGKSYRPSDTYLDYCVVDFRHCRTFKHHCFCSLSCGKESMRGSYLPYLLRTIGLKSQLTHKVLHISLVLCGHASKRGTNSNVRGHLNELWGDRLLSKSSSVVVISANARFTMYSTPG